MIINTIGDPTGFAESLKLLHTQMPEGKLWCVGDLIDRGPDSKGVMDYFIDNGHNSVMGNHDHMMLFEAIRNEPGVDKRLYPRGTWGGNGGVETLVSFGMQYISDIDFTALKKYFDYIRQMPLRFEKDNLIITHAPTSDKNNKRVFDLGEINKDFLLLDVSALWNRSAPNKIKGKFQVYGHNSPKGILWHTDKHPHGIYMSDPFEIPENAWAVCIDTWRETYLTGLSINTDLLDDPRRAIKIFQQDLVEKSPHISEFKRQMRIEYRKAKENV